MEDHVVGTRLTPFFVFHAIPRASPGPVEIGHPVNPGVPEEEVQRTASQVRIAVDGRVAGFEVEERFLNSGSRLAEGRDPESGAGAASPSSFPAAATRALGTLRSSGRFRLIAFSSGVRRFREDFVAANRDNLTAAREFVDRLGAEGGISHPAA
jgi:hypothetical protein